MNTTIFDSMQQPLAALKASMIAIRALTAKYDQEGRLNAELRIALDHMQDRCAALDRQYQESKDRAKPLVDSYKVQIDTLSSDLAKARKAEARQAARCHQLEQDNACAWERYGIVDDERRELEQRIQDLEQRLAEGAHEDALPKVDDAQDCVACGAPSPLRISNNIVHCLHCGERAELDFDGLE
jgi:chromosome segregation ATPase